MPGIKELLQDKSKFGDDLVFSIGEQSFKLGDVRAMNAETEGATKTQLEAIAKRQKELDDAAGVVATLYQEAMDAKVKAGAAPVTPAKAGAIEDDNFETDALYAPVAKRYKSLEAKLQAIADGDLKATKAELATLTKQFQQAVHAMTTFMSEQRFNALQLPEAARKELTADAALKHAIKSNMFGADGLPDVAKAANELSEKYRIDDIKKSAFEAGREQAKKEAAAAAVAKPTNIRGVKSAPDAKAPKTIGEALAQAVTDPELLDGAAAMGYTQ